MTTKITTATIDETVEQFKAQLLQEILSDAPELTHCYSNWFTSQINHETRVHRAAQSEHNTTAAANIGATVEAWQRARQLFLTLAAPALQELADTIAQQIEIEYAEHPVAASDVAGALRGTPLAEILQHMN